MGSRSLRAGSHRQQLAGLLTRITDGTISGKIAKEVFEVMWAESAEADAVIESRGLKQITDTGAIERAIERGDGRESRAARRLSRGKGQAVRLLRRPGDESDAAAKANPAQLNELLKRKLPG